MEKIQAEYTALAQMMSSSGWEILKRETEAELKTTDAILLGDHENDSGLSLGELRQRRVGIGFMLNRINQLMETYSQAMHVVDVDISEYDPYNNIAEVTQ